MAIGDDNLEVAIRTAAEDGIQNRSQRWRSEARGSTDGNHLPASMAAVKTFIGSAPPGWASGSESVRRHSRHTLQPPP